MVVKVLGSTKLGYEMLRDEVLEFAGKEANICYTTRMIEDIFDEEASKSISRARRTLRDGHHSIADHITYNLGISEIPKIVAMILNNEGVYATSEKSARYTEMHPSTEEQELYQKWLHVFTGLIEKEYGERFFQYQHQIDAGKDPVKETKKQITKLAQENARYMISVFTPTIMGYSVNVRQLKYLDTWFQKFIETAPSTPFNTELKFHMDEFREAIREYVMIDELKELKDRSLSLFDERKNRYEYFGEVYSTNYKGTFAQLAQAQRHRTLRYKMSFLSEPEFYVPRLIEESTHLKQEWLSDIRSLADHFPQGMLVMINERGTYEDLIQKCSERLCGCAQLEIAIQTQQTVQKYVKAIEKTYPEIYQILLPYATKARCQINWRCNRPCVWGAKDAFRRSI